MSQTNKYLQKWLSNLGLGFKADPITKDEYFNAFLSDRYQTTNPMLEWKNLPDTIPQWILNYWLQFYGYVFFTKLEGKYYIFFGSLGGEPNEYYIPTIATISNPYLKYSANLKIGKECVLMRNDRFCEGLLDWNKIYAEHMTEAMLTIRIALINSRAEYVISTTDDDEAEGAKAFLKQLEDGIHLGYLSSDGFLSNQTLNTIPFTNKGGTSIRSSIEAFQYEYSNWCRGVGLKASYNNKREYVNIENTTQPEDAIVNRSYQMLQCAKDACKEINALYGLNLDVDFGSVWKQREYTNKLQEKILKAQVNNLRQPKNNTEQPQEHKEEPKEDEEVKEDEKD